MPNTREKLIELLKEIDGVCPKDASCYNCEYDDMENCCVYAKADHLIANGVTVQEQIRDCHWATEQAYKNGYADGQRDTRKVVPCGECSFWCRNETTNREWGDCYCFRGVTLQKHESGFCDKGKRRQGDGQT